MEIHYENQDFVDSVPDIHLADVRVCSRNLYPFTHTDRLQCKQASTFALGTDPCTGDD